MSTGIQNPLHHYNVSYLFWTLQSIIINYYFGQWKTLVSRFIPLCPNYHIYKMREWPKFFGLYEKNDTAGSY